MELSNSQSAILAKQPSQDMQINPNQKDTIGDENSINLSKPYLGKSETQEQAYHHERPLPKVKTFSILDKDQKIKEIKQDLNSIESIIYQCEDIERREMLLERGLALSTLLNQLIKNYSANNKEINDTNNLKESKKVLYATKPNVASCVNEIQINPELLDSKYWTQKKVDRFEKTRERKKVPQEFWYNVKGQKFSKELHKSFALAMGDFNKNYKWLFAKK